ncbi:MAG: DUF2061 domain-containing protein [Parcubacteria group bacterium]|nr:DUF2061 domain-containing protein [Parcubacteria group bacterium]
MRSIFKKFAEDFFLAAEWRIIATFITVLVVYIVSGDIKLSLQIGGLEAIAKMIVQSIWIRIRVKKDGYRMKKHEI